MGNELNCLGIAHSPRQKHVIDRIKTRAYELYQTRGCEPGRDLEDWFQAEQQILLLLLLEDVRFAETANYDDSCKEPGTPDNKDLKKASRVPKTKSGMIRPAASSHPRRSAQKVGSASCLMPVN
jgi:hypothetical protein